MKSMNKYLVLFMVLLLAVNATFAAQMTPTMPMHNMPTITGQPDGWVMSLPCHEAEKERTGVVQEHKKTTNCCDGGCATCVSASAPFPSRHYLLTESADLVSHVEPVHPLTDQHAGSLYRPPIMI